MIFLSVSFLASPSESHFKQGPAAWILSGNNAGGQVTADSRPKEGRTKECGLQDTLLPSSVKITGIPKCLLSKFLLRKAEFNQDVVNSSEG